MYIMVATGRRAVRTNSSCEVVRISSGVNVLHYTHRDDGQPLSPAAVPTITLQTTTMSTRSYQRPWRQYPSRICWRSSVCSSSSMGKSARSSLAWARNSTRQFDQTSLLQFPEPVLDGAVVHPEKPPGLNPCGLKAVLAHMVDQVRVQLVHSRGIDSSPLLRSLLLCRHNRRSSSPTVKSTPLLYVTDHKVDSIVHFFDQVLLRREAWVWKTPAQDFNWVVLFGGECSLGLLTAVCRPV
jgi:hypothetical protein